MQVAVRTSIPGQPTEERMAHLRCIHLLEALKDVKYPRGDVLLRQSGTSRVEASCIDLRTRGEDGLPSRRIEKVGLEPRTAEGSRSSPAGGGRQRRCEQARDHGWGSEVLDFRE